MSHKKQKVISILCMVVATNPWYGCSQGAQGPQKAKITYSLGIVSSDGRVASITPGVIKGGWRKMIVKGKVRITGWAFDEKNFRLSEVILISRKGKIIYSGHSNRQRRDVAKRFGDAALKSGFAFDLPLKWFEDLNNSGLQLLAVSNGAASYLQEVSK